AGPTVGRPRDQRLHLGTVSGAGDDARVADGGREMRIEGTTALVTGGASGLGRATAEALVAAGGRVVLADLASSDGAGVRGVAGRRALVTGGAWGLGRAAAGALVAAGARAVRAGLASSDGAAVAGALGDAARFVPTDVTDEDDVARALDAADDLGGARVVVSCAGIVLAQRVIGESGLYAVAASGGVVDVDLVGRFHVVRLAAERMLALDPLGPDGPDP